MLELLKGEEEEGHVDVDDDGNADDDSIIHVHRTRCWSC